MCILNGRRHQRIGFRRGIAKHDPLVACTFVLTGRRINALGDMCGLFVQQVCDLHRFVMEFFLLVSDVFDTGAGDRINPAHIILELFLIRQANLATDHHTVRRGKRFTGHAGLWFLGYECIKDRI